jgi:phosphatidylglycerophosphate synthase
LSFAGLAGRRAHDWTGPRLAPNAVTAVRLLITCWMAFALHAADGQLLAAVVAGVFALDGLDGWLARRYGARSEFGAAFDMEADALLVLLTEFELWQRGQFGPWILATGLLRYLYVLCLTLVKSQAGPMPRSRLARYAFSMLLVGLIAAFLLRRPFDMLVAACGSLPVVASFARAFHWSYRAEPQKGVV